MHVCTLQHCLIRRGILDDIGGPRKPTHLLGRKCRMIGFRSAVKKIPFFADEGNSSTSIVKSLVITCCNTSYENPQTNWILCVTQEGAISLMKKWKYVFYEKPHRKSDEKPVNCMENSLSNIQITISTEGKCLFAQHSRNYLSVIPINVTAGTVE